MAPSPRRTRSVVQKEIEKKKSAASSKSAFKAKKAKQTPTRKASKSKVRKQEKGGRVGSKPACISSPDNSPEALDPTFETLHTQKEPKSKVKKQEKVGRAGKKPGFAASSDDTPGAPTFENFFLSHLTEKQRNKLSKEFTEKVGRLGKALVALAAAKRDYTEADQKVFQLEETYGKTMKIQDIWHYQERAGLAAVIGQDPQAIMNAEHLFKDEERLMFYSAYPRQSKIEKKEEEEAQCSKEKSPSPRRSPPRTRTRTQQEILLKQIKKRRNSSATASSKNKD